MIKLIDVYKTYHNGVVALNGVNLHIEQGEFVYVVGPSGAGKSTFIKLIYHEEVPTKGDVIIDGVEINKLKPKNIPYLRRDIGVVFQDFKLLTRLTVYENVAFALEVIEESPEIIRERVIEVLDLVGLQSKVKSLQHELPCGRQHPVSTARSIASRHMIVLN